MRSQKSKNTQKMYKLLDEFISYMYDKRTGSDMTADSYYRDIDRFITYLADHDITSLKKVSKEDIQKVANNYLDENYVLTILAPQTALDLIKD